jgi:protocatechuate 3,4-dioxygenase, alpha subunit
MSGRRPPVGHTPSQTIGPFFGFALPWPAGPHAARADLRGAVRICGRLLDGSGDPVPDGLIETWQAGPDGRFPGATGKRDDGGAASAAGATAAPFRGFARCPTDSAGRYEIVTLKPGVVHDRAGVPHAPHLTLSVFARGLLKAAVTRIYFADEEAANAADPVLARIPDAATRATLLAVAQPGGYRFDVRLQGDGETLFLTFHD